MGRDGIIDLGELEKFVNTLNECTDSYVFIFDYDEDKMLISEDAVVLFDIPSSYFDNATQIISNIVFSADKQVHRSAMEDLVSGRKNYFNLEYRWINRSGKAVWVSSRAKFMPEENGRKIIVGCVMLTDPRDKVDPITQLPTEALMRTDFHAAYEKRHAVSGFVLKVDIDNLNVINELYGKKSGDLVIKMVADCLVRASGTLGRVYKLSSDEFIIMNLRGNNALDAQKMFQILKRELADAEMRIDYDVVFTVSIGAVAFFNDNSQLDDFLKKAQFAVESAKKKGKNNLTMFNAVAYAKHIRNLDIQDKIRDSIKNNFRGFELYYQPVVDAKNIWLDEDKTVSNIIGCEALIRWSHPELGRLSPDEFIPILENTGLIIPVGRWIMITAFNKCREWNKIQKTFHMSVNLSYIQVKKSDILTDVQIALGASGVDPANITLELTESGYMDSENELQRLVGEFNKMGLKVDIDDFGTGYSNLRYLQYLNAYTLKLDYSFVHKATGGDEGDRKVIRHITQMAHELDMLVCMEGVETEDDIVKLEEFAPDKFQGYFFGRPCNDVDFREHHLRPDINADTYKHE